LAGVAGSLKVKTGLSAKTPVTGRATVLCGGAGLDSPASGRGLGFILDRTGCAGAMGARGGMRAAGLIGLVGGAGHKLVPSMATSLVRTTLESEHLCFFAVFQELNLRLHPKQDRSRGGSLATFAASHSHSRLVSRTRSFIRFSELESLSVDMIRWLVT
jgi:hypothetical protein